MPTYFCEESLECISRAGIKLCHYRTTPLSNPDDIPSLVDVEDGDGLLIVNYFAHFGRRHFSGVRCEIVEDHTHNLIGDWAGNSEADWCIASLRKTLPIADGGILWSPKGHSLPARPSINQAAIDVIDKRFCAMKLKERYLSGEHFDKDFFLRLFRETEDAFGMLPISLISDVSYQIISRLDITTWYAAKKDNFRLLKGQLTVAKSIRMLLPENNTDIPFSLILLFKDSAHRNVVRKALISQSIYPAVLWNIETVNDSAAKHIGDTMLSIHCDGRYSQNDMTVLSNLINESLKKLNGDN